MNMRYVSLLATVLFSQPASVPSQALGCIPGAVAYTKATVCGCDGATGYPGGCQGTTNSRSVCFLMSDYPCSAGCGERWLFTETSYGACHGASLRSPQWGIPSHLSLALFAHETSAKEPAGSCAMSTLLFRDWLTHEMNLQNSKATL